MRAKLKRSSEPRARAGRPPRVTREQIAEATLALGLEQATVRSVAEALGMSTQGLYHHVRVRDDLIDIAVAHALRLQVLPDPQGKTWREWLVGYAESLFTSLVTQPAFISYMISGPGFATARLEQEERILEVLTSYSFSLVEAYEAYRQVLSAVIGAASIEARNRAIALAGITPEMEISTAVGELGPSALPLVRQLALEWTSERGDLCRSAVGVVLDGITFHRADGG